MVRALARILIITLAVPLLALGSSLGASAPATAGGKVCPEKSEIGVCWIYKRNQRTIVFQGGDIGFVARVVRGPRQGAERTVQAGERDRIRFSENACHKRVGINFAYPGKYTEGYFIKLRC